MYAMDAVKLAAANNDISMYRLAKDMGITQQAITNISGKGQQPGAARLAKMLEQVNYTLCAVPSDNVPPDALVID